MDSCLFALFWCRNRWHEVWTGQISCAWTMQLLIYTIWPNMSCLCSRPGMPSRVEWRWEDPLWLSQKAVQEIRSWNKMGIIENERHFAKASAEATKILNVYLNVSMFFLTPALVLSILCTWKCTPCKFFIAICSSLGTSLPLICQETVSVDPCRYKRPSHRDAIPWAEGASDFPRPSVAPSAWLPSSLVANPSQGAIHQSPWAVRKQNESYTNPRVVDAVASLKSIFTGVGWLTPRLEILGRNIMFQLRLATSWDHFDPLNQQDFESIFTKWYWESFASCSKYSSSI